LEDGADAIVFAEVVVLSETCALGKGLTGGLKLENFGITGNLMVPFSYILLETYLILSITFSADCIPLPSSVILHHDISAYPFVDLLAGERAAFQKLHYSLVKSFDILRVSPNFVSRSLNSKFRKEPCCVSQVPRR
jgi:hypothetical protein